MPSAPAALSGAVQPGLALTPFFKVLMCNKTPLHSGKSGGTGSGVRLGDRLVLTEEMLRSTLCLLEEVAVIWLCSDDSAKYLRQAQAALGAWVDSNQSRNLGCNNKRRNFQPRFNSALGTLRSLG